MHATLADILTDLVQNSVESGADRIDITLYDGTGEIRFSVADNGRGMDRVALERAEDPFWTDGVKHPGRRVGLGIPLLRQTAEQAGGRVEIDSAPGRGTRVDASFPANHLDRPPLGDPVLLWLQCLIFDGAYGMTIRRVRQSPEGREVSYTLDRAELAEVLGGLEDAFALGALREYLVSQEEYLDEVPAEGEIVTG
jgi:hypothetical protein